MGKTGHPIPTPEGWGVAIRSAKLRRSWVGLHKSAGSYLLISPFYLIFTVFFLYPILFSLYLSLTKCKGLGPITFVGLYNYAILLKEKVFWQTFGNSAILFFMHVPLMLLMALILAVLMNSPRLRGFQFFRFLIALPYISNLVASGITFKILLDQKYGLVNRFLSKLGVFFMRQYISSIPDELLNAARLDGAGDLTLYRAIILPLSMPALTSLGIIVFISQWNNFVWPLVVLQTPEKFTFPIVLSSGALTGPEYMASIVISLIPLLIIYLLFQKRFLEGITFEALNG
jgi:multiple sugar transport system permease protein